MTRPLQNTPGSPGAQRHLAFPVVLGHSCDRRGFAGLLMYRMSSGRRCIEEVAHGGPQAAVDVLLGLEKETFERAQVGAPWQS